MGIYAKATLGYPDNQITFNDYTRDPIYRTLNRMPQKYQIRQEDIPVPFESGVADFSTLIGQTVYIIQGKMYPSSEGTYDSGLAALRAASSLDIEQTDPYSANVFSNDGYVPYIWGDSSGDYTKQLFVKPLYVMVAENTQQGFVLPFTIYCKVKDPTIYSSILKIASTQAASPIAQQVITNLIINPSFETNTTGWASYHTGTLAQSAAQSFSGGNSCSVVTTGGGVTAQGLSSPVVTGLTPSSSYTASIYVYMPAGVSYTLEVDTNNSSGTFVASYTTTGTGNGGWQRISLATALGSTETQAQLFIYTTTSTTFYVDAAMLQSGTSASTYFDGSLTSNTSNTYAWLGTANASASTNTVYKTGNAVYPFQYPIVYGATYYTVTATATNSGNIPTYPQSIDIYGPINVPILTNGATGEFLKINVNLNSSTDHLQIQYGKDYLAVTLNGVSVLNNVSADSTYFKVHPQGNGISLTGTSIGSSAYATVAYYDGYALA